MSTAVGTGEAKLTYELPVVLSDTMASNGETSFSNATGIGLGIVTTVTAANTVEVNYSGSYIEKILMLRARNRFPVGINKNTLFRIFII